MYFSLVCGPDYELLGAHCVRVLGDGTDVALADVEGKCQEEQATTKPITVKKGSFDTIK